MTSFLLSICLLSIVASAVSEIDPFLVDSWYSPEASITFTETGSFSGTLTGIPASGSWNVNMSKSPMWIDWNVPSFGIIIQGIYKTRVTPEGKKEYVMAMASQNDLLGGTAQRPMSFEAAATVITFLGSDAPPSSMLDPFLVDNWHFDFGSLTLTETGSLNGTITGIPFVGSWNVNMSKSPMWIDWNIPSSGTLIPGIYKTRVTPEGKKEYVMAISQNDLLGGTGERPTAFEAPAMVITYLGSDAPPPPMLDPFLVDNWHFDFGSLTLTETGSLNGTITGVPLVGSWNVSMSKSPMWIDWNIPSSGTLIPGIYKTRVTPEGKKEYVMAISQDDLLGGTGERPTAFEAPAMVITYLGSDAPPPPQPPTLDSKLFGHWVDQMDNMLALMEDGMYNGMMMGMMTEGTWVTNMSKNPMQIDFMQQQPMAFNIPGIYETSEMDGEMVFKLQLPSQPELQSGNPKRPQEFTTMAMLFVEQKDEPEECPPTLTCDECSDLCKKTCKVTEEYSKEFSKEFSKKKFSQYCQKSCQKKICSVFGC